MRVGTLTASVSHNAGGLFESVSALSRATQAVPGVTILVHGLRDRHTEVDLAQWDPMSVSLCDKLGPAVFGFAPHLQRNLARADIDILHVHGIWMFPSVAALRWSRACGKPYVVSTHGMLDPWAVRHSKWKKRLAHLTYEGVHLRGASCLRALCASEAEAIRAFGLRNPIALIPNGVYLPDLSQALAVPSWASRLPADAKVLFFLSRLHPKKGLPNLLRAWAKARQRGVMRWGDWHLVIAGWEQGGHRAELDQLATTLDIRPTVHLVGPQFGMDKSASFMHADAFVLPSVSEGLPMAVLEAWSYRLPVLMTPQCNLPEGFVADAAVRIEPEIDSIAEGLRILFAMDADARKAMGLRGRQLVARSFCWPKIGEDMVGVYRWILDGGSPPPMVRLD